MVRQRNEIKPEKMKFPIFSGNIRTFARFKKDFSKIVVPFYADMFQTAYVMKESCLKGKAKSLVENIDDMDEIWKRLESKYGDKIDLVDLVISEINDVPSLKSNDDQKFIDLVDKLERGLIDLEAIDARRELANAYTVKTIERKLSRNVYMDWLKTEPGSDDRFDKLFAFLVGERRRVEQLVRKNDTPKEIPTKEKSQRSGDGSFGTNTVQSNQNGDRRSATQDGQQNRQQNDGKIVKNTCLLHPSAAHFTRKCRAFLAKTTKERGDIIKKTQACPFCLSITHQSNPCPWKGK